MHKHRTKLVSIIIPTKNSSVRLPQLINSINNQSHKKIETIVVDNKSIDETKNIARKLKALVFDKGPERGAQKNYGAMKASGNYVFFLDDDMELNRKVVEDCLNSMPQYDAIMVPEESVGEGFWNKCVILERSCYVGDDDMEAARFFKKTIFNKLNGFDENLVASGDDLDLNQRTRRKGFKIGRIHSFIIHHEGPRDPLSTIKKWRYYGRNMVKYYAKNPKEAALQYLPLRRSWIKNWRKLINHPILTAGFIFLKFCNLIGVVWGQLEAWLQPHRPKKYNPYQI